MVRDDDYLVYLSNFFHTYFIFMSYLTFFLILRYKWNEMCLWRLTVCKVGAMLFFAFKSLLIDWKYSVLNKCIPFSELNVTGHF